MSERLYTRDQLVEAMQKYFEDWLQKPEEYLTLNEVADLRLAPNEHRPAQIVDKLLSFVRIQ